MDSEQKNIEVSQTAQAETTTPVASTNTHSILKTILGVIFFIIVIFLILFLIYQNGKNIYVNGV